MTKILIHVGFPKAASCFLGDWFHLHPALDLKNLTLAELESTSGLCKFDESTNDNVKYFVIKDMLFSTPFIRETDTELDVYEYQKKNCIALFELFPNSKILIVTKGFESALISDYIQYIKEGGIYSMEGLIEKYSDKNLFINDYDSLIKLYCQYFGKENVIVVPFELLIESSDVFLSYIENQLSLPHSDIEISKKNVSPPKHIIFAQRRLNNAIHNFSRITGKPGKFLQKLYLKNLDSKKTTPENFFYLKMISFFYKNKKEDLSILLSFIMKFEKFGDILKEYPIYEKYYNLYLINQEEEKSNIH